MRDQAVWPRILAAGVVLTLSVLGATLLAETARFFWLGDLAVHFPVQYAGLALLLFLLFVAGRRPGWAALALALAAVNFMNAGSGLSMRPVAIPKTLTDPMRLRVASVNVFYRNRQYGRVADFIRHEKPDAVVLVEMDDAWRRGLASVEREYPYHYRTQGSSGRGVDLWSRHPLKDVGVLPIEAREPAIQATLLVQGRALRLFAVHTSWPMSPRSAARRNRQLSLMAQLARSTALPLIALGDFNVTPYSPHFRQLLVDGDLHSAAEGFGWQPTWPSFVPPAGIQIDHGFVRSGLIVQSFRHGPRNGSDHRPIVFDLLF